MKKSLLVLAAILSMSAFADSYTRHDYRSGNTYSVNSYGDTTTVRGYNTNTGSTWSQTSNSNGSYSGTDSRGNYYSGNNNTGFYQSSSGKTCYGKGAYRTCN